MVDGNLTFDDFRSAMFFVFVVYRLAECLSRSHMYTVDVEMSVFFLS